MNDERKQNLSRKAKLRWSQILKIQRAYGIDEYEAIAKWSNLKNLDILNFIIVSIDMELTTYPEEKCPKCGKDLVARVGQFEPFLSCSNYPVCDGKRNIPKNFVPVPDSDKQIDLKNKIDETMHFIKVAGSVTAAEKLIAIVKQLMEL